MLVLTHELADLSTAAQMSVTRDFYPMKPLVLYCRSPTLGSPCKAEYTMLYGWRDPLSMHVHT